MAENSEHSPLTDISSVQSPDPNRTVGTASDYEVLHRNQLHVRYSRQVTVYARAHWRFVERNRRLFVNLITGVALRVRHIDTPTWDVVYLGLKKSWCYTARNDTR